MNHCITILSICIAFVANTAEIVFPNRSRNVCTVQEFVKANMNSDAYRRDSVVVAQISCGNVPDFLRRSVDITDTLPDVNGKLHIVTMRVAPDVIMIGNDTNYLRMPLLPATAQKIADMCDATLPTSRMSDLIHRHSVAKLKPIFTTPDSEMTTLARFVTHDSLINVQMREMGICPGTFVAGQKKDIVITNYLDSIKGRVCIYGWHHKNGVPQQPLFTRHGDFYVDYSHGVRLVSKIVIVDGKPMPISSILRHPTLYTLLSDESAPMRVCRYASEMGVSYYSADDTCSSAR